MKTESLLQYIDGYLGVSEHPDYRTALNGLQVEGPDDVTRIAAAVDASETTIRMAVEVEADMLLVHHGMFWDGLRPVTGRRYRRVAPLIRHDIALYAVHLPLDAHPEVGNCALLADALDVERSGRFGSYDGVPIGWRGTLSITRDALEAKLGDVLGGPVRTIPGGPERIETVGIVTGGGGSFVEEARDAGLDALVTGEGTHHSFIDAMEMGVNVLFGGHYATETFGVKALAAHLAERFGLDWTFVDDPSGM